MDSLVLFARQWTTVENLQYPTVLQAHAWICGLASILLIPGTAWFGRYGPYLIRKRTTKWYVHAGIGFALVVLLIVGGMLGFVHRNRPTGPSPGAHWIAPHGILGLCVMVIMAFQFLLGLVVFYVKPTKKKPPQNWIHRILGFLMYGAAIADCILGFQRWPLLYTQDASAIVAWTWGFVGMCIGFLLIYIAIGEVLRVKDKKRRAAKRLARQQALDSHTKLEPIEDDSDEMDFDHLGDGSEETSETSDEEAHGKVPEMQETVEIVTVPSVNASPDLTALTPGMTPSSSTDSLLH